MARVVLHQTAPWNPRLRNGYRERYAQVGGRYFKVSADGLRSWWWCEEIDADGQPLVRRPAYKLVWGDWARNLDEARGLVAARAAS